MLYGMEVLWINCHLNLGSGSGVVGTSDCEWSGDTSTRMLKSESRSSIVRLLRIVYLFIQSKVIHQSDPSLHLLHVLSNVYPSSQQSVVLRRSVETTCIYQV